MPKYRVKADAPVIVHGRKEVRETYQPGDVVELSEEEAKKIGLNLEMVHGKAVVDPTLPEPPPADTGGQDITEDDKGRKKKKPK